MPVLPLWAFVACCESNLYLYLKIQLRTTALKISNHALFLGLYIKPIPDTNNKRKIFGDDIHMLSTCYNSVFPSKIPTQLLSL